MLWGSAILLCRCARAAIILHRGKPLLRKARLMARVKAMLNGDLRNRAIRSCAMASGRALNITLIQRGGVSP